MGPFNLMYFTSANKKINENLSTLIILTRHSTVVKSVGLGVPTFSYSEEAGPVSIKYERFYGDFLLLRNPSSTRCSFVRVPKSNVKEGQEVESTQPCEHPVVLV